MSSRIKWLKDNSGKIVVAWVLMIVILLVVQSVVNRLSEEARQRDATRFGQPYVFGNSILTLERFDFAEFRYSEAEDSDKKCMDFGYGFPFVHLTIYCDQDAQDSCHLRLSAEITHESGHHWGNMEGEKPSRWWDDVSEVRMLPGEDEFVSFFNPYCTARYDQMVLMRVRVQDLTGDTRTERAYFNLDKDAE
jgi:hypothetical protein